MFLCWIFYICVEQSRSNHRVAKIVKGKIISHKSWYTISSTTCNFLSNWQKHSLLIGFIIFYCFIFNVVRTLWKISSVSIYTTFFLMNSQVILSHGQTNLHFILLSIYDQLSISRISRYLMISQVPTYGQRNLHFNDMSVSLVTILFWLITNDDNW